MKKTDGLLKIVYLFLILALAYGIYEFVWGKGEGWELDQLLVIGGIVLFIAAVGYFGNKISRKNKGL